MFNHYRVIVIFALLLMPSIALADNSFLKNKTVTGCENEEGYPPFIYRNPDSGKLEGYSVDLLNLVFEDSGATLKYSLLPWKRCLKYMGKGKIMDLVLAAASTKERREEYLFSDAFSKVHLAYFYDRKKYYDGLKIKTPSDLDKLTTVCGMRGFVYGSYGLTNKVWQQADDFQQLITLVAKDRCDALLIRYEVFKSLTKANPQIKYYDRMKGGIIPWRKDNPIKFYFMAAKNSPYHKQLIDFINKRMKEISQSGDFRQIKEKYGFIVD